MHDKSTSDISEIIKGMHGRYRISVDLTLMIENKLSET